jgi:hypothetical protein
LLGHRRRNNKDGQRSDRDAVQDRFLDRHQRRKSHATPTYIGKPAFPQLGTPKHSWQVFLAAGAAICHKPLRGRRTEFGADDTSTIQLELSR